jgi:predicted N-acetyltransferase YhbS
MDIHYLGDRREVIPVVASWIYEEWSFLFPGKTVRYVESLLRKRVHKNKLPMTLVAFESGRPVGTVSLKTFDLETRKDLKPWAASLYVAEPWRKKGVGSALIKAAEQKAVELKISKLFLFTIDELVPFYLKLGWKVKEETEHNSYTIIIMEKELKKDVS